jgi:hypothetical protein
LLTNSTIPGGFWGNVEADENDIIEYNGSSWIVSFDASAVAASAYTTNANTMKKLYFTGTEWVLAVEGTFDQGWWRIVN